MQNPLRNAAATLSLLAAATAALVPAAPAFAQDTQDQQSRPATRPEPVAQRSVTEDDAVRIEEVKVRGQTQSITVKSKLRGVKPYEIVPASGARDPSQPGSPAGQRVWHFLSF